MAKYSFRIQGPNSTMQRALPAILANTPEKFYLDSMDKLQKTGIALHARLSKIEGLTPLLPAGAMYLMCGGLDNFASSDKEFIELLHEEERVFILPGACFRYVSDFLFAILSLLSLELTSFSALVGSMVTCDSSRLLPFLSSSKLAIESKLSAADTANLSPLRLPLFLLPLPIYPYIASCSLPLCHSCRFLLLQLSIDSLFPYYRSF